ncbi:MAG: hypothetical protein K0S71_200 [Clostridia bacterium]|jgi:multimeric flavodoxin WrbA|nr:hypothetical protein [Clostridia bacterium]
MRLVVYYSRKGHVKKAAVNYAAKKGYEIMEIKDLVNHSGILGFIKAGYAASRKKCTPIQKINANIGSYDRVIVFSPIWAGSMASPIRTFLRDYGSKAKELEYVIMRADKKNDYKSTFAEMDAVANKKHVAAASLVQGETL